MSRPRQLVSDHCYFAGKTPTGVLRKTVNVAPLMRARASLKEKPPWVALFMKALALVAQDNPPLRRAYVKLPWPHFYEYYASVASLVVERDYQGEPALFLARIKRPEEKPVGDIAAEIAEAKSAPVESVNDYRVALRFALLPMLLRRALMWIALNLGGQRPNFFGTFGMSVMGGDGVKVLFPISPWTIFFSYGPIADNGDVELVIGFDHRVMDGAIIVRVFGEIAAKLNGAIAVEIGATGRQ